MHVSLQESLLFSLLFLFGREHHHTHQKYLNFLSRTHKNSPSSPLQKSRNLGTFQEDFASKSSSKVRLCIDLWFKFFCYQNPSLIYTKIVILHPRIISKLKIFIKGSQGQKSLHFSPIFFQKPSQHPKVRFIPLFSVFMSFCGGGGIQVKV